LVMCYDFLKSTELKADTWRSCSEDSRKFSWSLRTRVSFLGK
jgi:hypothetical protein